MIHFGDALLAKTARFSVIKMAAVVMTLSTSTSIGAIRHHEENQ